jgi:surface antigen
MMCVLRWYSVLLFAALLGACTTSPLQPTSGVSPTPSIGEPTPSPAAVMPSAPPPNPLRASTTPQPVPSPPPPVTPPSLLITDAGGVIDDPQIGPLLSTRDRHLAHAAELSALGSANWQQWSNRDNGHHGEVKPDTSVYRLGGDGCRYYVHTVYLDGRQEVVRGTGCRNPNGTWSNRH